MTEHEFEMGEGALCWFKDATIRYRCGRIADDPIHHTAAAPTEQATQPGFWEEQQDYADERDSTEQATADRGYHSQRGILAKHREASAGDAATDVDSTAEVCRCAARMYSHPRGETPCIYREPSAGSPVTAGVPDTTAIRARCNEATGPEGWGWRHFGDDPENLCRIVYYPTDPSAQWQVIADEIVAPADAAFIAAAREDVPALLAALDAMTVKADTYQRQYYAEHGEIAAELDAARGELVTARGERDEAERRLYEKTEAANEIYAQLAAGNARIAAVEALCDREPEYIHSWRVRSAVAGVPAAGERDAGEGTR